MLSPESVVEEYSALYGDRMSKTIHSRMSIQKGHKPAAETKQRIETAEQTEQVTNKWLRASAGAVSIIPVSPYNGMEPVLKAAETICPDEIDMIVMDCIGYTVEMKEKIHAMTGKPVVLPRTLVARMINELV